MSESKIIFSFDIGHLKFELWHLKLIRTRSTQFQLP